MGRWSALLQGTVGLSPDRSVAAGVCGLCVCHVSRVSVGQAQATPWDPRTHGPGCVGCWVVSVSTGLSLQTAAGPLGLVGASPDPDVGPLGTKNQIQAPEQMWGAHPGRVDSSRWGEWKVVHWDQLAFWGSQPRGLSGSPTGLHPLPRTPSLSSEAGPQGTIWGTEALGQRAAQVAQLLTAPPH